MGKEEEEQQQEEQEEEQQDDDDDDEDKGEDEEEPGGRGPQRTRDARRAGEAGRDRGVARQVRRVRGLSGGR